MFGLKKKINENENVIKIKEIWVNKKYRSLIMLGIYFIFFVFLGIAFRTTPTNNLEGEYTHDISVLLSEFEDYLNNDYQYKLVINNTNILIFNIKNGVNSFVYQNEDYMIINNSIYRSEGNNLVLVEQFLNTSISLEYLTLDNILSNIKNVEPIYDNELNNGFETLYNVELNNLVTVEECDDKVQIKLNGDDGQIEEFEIQYLLDSYVIKIVRE